ncbi:RHS repeat domain-containing protein [Arthrobacter alpinus]|uniref:RHS repeat domain-containing protein n=1 Tax=Arthrobacter alpinus TaxID=656366 RepID=UPI000783ECAA|nr:RHS repeat-associated core domain-containing protein [Arthrobacter alpinus]
MSFEGVHGRAKNTSMIAGQEHGRRPPNSLGKITLAGVLSLVLLGVAITPAQAAIAPAATADLATTGLLGSRPGATRLPVPINDHVGASVDVGTGNLFVSVNAMTLPGINGDTGIGATFNSLSQNTDTGLAGARWTLNVASAGTLATAPTGILYTAGDGYSALFTPVSGSTTAYTAPAGVKADLVKTSSGWSLTSRTSATVVVFNADGHPTTVKDRNGNATTITWATGGNPTTVTATRGGTAARTAKLTYNSATGTIASIIQGSGTTTRTVSLAHDPYGVFTGYTDLAGKTTRVSITGGLIYSITPPTGGTVSFTYDSSRRVTSITRTNTAPGSPGNSITRFAYPTGSQTLIAGPNTDQGSAVSTVAHTTYTLDANARVTAATDAAGRAQSKTYTADFDTLSATQGTGTTAGTTTNTYGANTGQSITASQSPGGATGQAAYANTAAATKYLASSATDDAGNTSLYTFDGPGNMLTSTDATAATATLSYNPDGTVATALAPGNGSNKTLYTYNTDHQLTSVSPVTGSSLGARAFTYDSWGRALTATDGRGTTTTYGYDADDRLTSTTFSDSTAAVAYTYNDNGQTLTRVDGAGTTTYGYDQLGRLTSRVNTAGGGTISYGYDKASNLASTTDTRGTTTYTYDDSGVPTSLLYQYNGATHVLAFATDSRGRRTDTWMDANPAHTSWAAHSHTDYDTTGRVTRTTAQVGTGDADNRPVMDLSYCHAAGSTAPICPTTTSADRSNIQWVKDNLTNAVTAYSYDTANRLTKATVTGGTSPTTYTYTYDVRGNRLTATTTGTTPSSQTFNANPANQIGTTGYSYDGTGNLTQDPKGTYAYNGAQQMTQVTKSGTTYNYTYAGASQNELLAESTPKGYYKLTYGRTDAEGQPIIEQLSKDAGTAYIEHDPVTGEPLMLRTSAGMASLYITDGTGNPTALITAGNYVAVASAYDPYGVQTITKDTGGNATDQTPYTFKQGLQDRTTGWVKYGARWYNPTTGRWTQQDTLDAPLDPANANRYAYAANNPINNTDPTGRDVGGCIGGVATTIGGYAAFGAGLLTTEVGVGFLGVVAGLGGIVGGLATVGQQCYDTPYGG